MTKSEPILVNYSDQVCTLTINNPGKRNLLNPQTLESLSDIIKDASGNRKIRCIVLTGSGEKAFSSGYDISSIDDNDMMRDYDQSHPLNRAMNSIEEYPYPVIAMMNGHAFGAGLELAVTCDIRVCTDKALLGIPPAKLGVTYTYTGIRKFLNLVGTGHTKEMFLTGEPVNAERAEQIGLVNKTLSSDRLSEYTYSLAERITGNAPLSMESMKIIIRHWQNNQRLAESDEVGLRSMIDRIQNSLDYKEGRKAFSEKRKPQFRGE